MCLHNLAHFHMCIKMSTCGNKTENTWNDFKCMSSSVNGTFAHILTCRYTVWHVEKQRTNEIMQNLSSHVNCTVFVETKLKTHEAMCTFWSTMCNSHVKRCISRYGDKTEKTLNHVKCKSSHVNCTFLQILTCGYTFLWKQNRTHKTI